MEGIIKYKEEYVIRREIETGKGEKKKLRSLVYPFGRLRSIHEKLKFHFGKVKQPEYMYSPRKGRSQRDNAILHVGQTHFLRIDIKQFYPSTTSEHVYRWAKYQLGMRDDVAGLFTKLVTIDGAASFGSPLTPVLCTLVHRRMFDRIHEQCLRRGLRMSLWVDDITISGAFVPGELVETIREIVRSFGLKSHKLQFATGSRHVSVTGIMVSRKRVDAPKSLHQEIFQGYNTVFSSEDRLSAEVAVDKLLSRLGRYRYVVGRRTSLGVRTSNRLNVLRLKKSSILSALPLLSTVDERNRGVDFDAFGTGVPFEVGGS